jgi:hypothetical protein
VGGVGVRPQRHHRRPHPRSRGVGGQADHSPASAGGRSPGRHLGRAQPRRRAPSRRL